MARPRTGSKYLTKSGWRARLTIEIDGESVQRTFDLETTDEQVAEIKLKRLVKSTSSPAQLKTEAKRIETLSEAIERVVRDCGKEGLKTWQERMALLNRYTPPRLLAMPVDTIGPKHIVAALKAARDAGLSRQTVVHYRNGLHGVLDSLWRDEILPSNPVVKAKMPKGCKIDKRPRVSPNDDEFAHFMACGDVPEEVHLMALTARAFGGMRTSDLHAWDWSHVDTDKFAMAQVYRPKTDDDEDADAVLEEIIIPDVLRGPLVAWWTRWGKRTDGPVFPVMRGKRAGERQGKRSHARALRSGFWAAGVHRPLAGFPEAMQALTEATRAVELVLAQPSSNARRAAWWEALRVRHAAEEQAKALDAIQTDCAKTRRLDFHSLRRSYNTALAAAGVNVQTAMALAGHKSPNTHARYVQLSQLGPLSQPATAMPHLLPSGVSASPVLKLAAGSELSVGDPSESRTRVTGVRGSPSADLHESEQVITRGCAGPDQQGSAPIDAETAFMQKRHAETQKLISDATQATLLWLVGSWSARGIAIGA
jgi:integrase